MVINYKKKFLFVHIQKTAGSSITNYLSKIPGTSALGPNHNFISETDLDLQDFYKFCFVRNPFDRLVSWYNMIIQKNFDNIFTEYVKKNSKTFSDFIYLTDIIYENSIENPNGQTYRKSIVFNQLDYISDKDGNVIVDFIGRFENITDDFVKVKQKLNFDSELPFINSYKHEHYRSWYSDNDIERVSKLYKRDLEYFGYEF